MSDRTAGKRDPNTSPKGDANIPDFLEQQQGAADLANFALQSAAGASLGGVITADGAQLVPTPLVAGADISGYTVGNSTDAVELTAVDPVGAPASIALTPTGAAFFFTLATPTAQLPDGAFVRLIGGFQHHRVSHDVQLLITVRWFDVAGLEVADASGRYFHSVIPFSFTTSNTDTWLHVDKLIARPPTAVLYTITCTFQTPDSSTISATALTYVNNLQLKPASSFDGAHSGLVTQRAAWWLPWGVVPNGFASTVTAVTGVTTVATDIGVSITVALQDNRLYKCSLLARSESSVANDKSTLALTDASGSVYESVDRAHPIINTGEPHAVYFIFQAPAGTYTIKGRIVRLSGTGNIKVNASSTLTNYLILEDVGPASEPPEGFAS